MTVTVPNVPTPVPSRTDPTNFATRADAYHTALPGIVSAMNTQNAENNALNSSTVASAASASSAKVAAEAAAANAAASLGGQLWVSGTTYAEGYLVYSRLNQRSYRRLSTGSGTVDPSLDLNNWEMLSVVVEQTDIGQRPNKTPLNAYLGKLAFQDPETLVLKPLPSVTPQGLGELVFELTSNTSLSIRVKALDGTVRSATLTLS